MSDNSIISIQNDIIEEFSLFDNWEEKYEYIIDMGKKLPPMNETYKTDDHKIKGCQSTVWMYSEYTDGKVLFHADSDAIIAKGLISMLVRVFSGHTPDEIIDSPIAFLDEIGMMKHLAQTRSNGLRAMLKQMKMDAVAWKAKQQA
ncbi:MAG: SufE family protein [Chitinophagaceae bacterium]